VKLISILCLLFFTSPSFAVDTVRYNLSLQYPDPKQQYYIDILELALDASVDTFGEYELLAVNIEMPQGRASTVLELNEVIDVTWRMTTVELEQRLKAVPVPLLRGLMGYRIGIIRKGEQENFPANITAEQLRNIVIGQGHDWPDSIILRHNGMTVVEGLEHTMFTMLRLKRFDFFLRALNEPWVEVADKPHLVVEKNILVQYSAPIFFFVNRNNLRLHERLTVGLNIAIDDGRFQRLFEGHPVTANMISNAKLKQRKVFKLFNPLLSVETKKLQEDKWLWY
tara:strand:- start:804 stop:1649 length:846 start_codon:yes stop_codon:yes gene_type:complete